MITRKPYRSSEGHLLVLVFSSALTPCDVGGSSGAFRMPSGKPSDAETTASPCPSGMLLVSARSGKEPVPAYEQRPPLAAFCLSRTEATIADWAECVAAGGCSWPSHEEPDFIKPWRRMGKATWLMGNPEMPINFVDHSTAASFCEWATGRLPSRDEWDWAYASARADYNVPWGKYLMLPADDDTPNALPRGSLCRSIEHVILRSIPCPAASSSGDETLQGIFDMAANVQEWTSTPAGDTMFEVAGDDFTHHSRHFLPNGGAHPPRVASSTIGVRCAADPRR
jgi:formylglycine-generating enzyme required for sulfatase activity